MVFTSLVEQSVEQLLDNKRLAIKVLGYGSKGRLLKHHPSVSLPNTNGNTVSRTMQSLSIMYEGIFHCVLSNPTL